MSIQLRFSLEIVGIIRGGGEQDMCNNAELYCIYWQ